MTSSWAADTLIPGSDRRCRRLDHTLENAAVRTRSAPDTAALAYLAALMRLRDGHVGTDVAAGGSIVIDTAPLAK